MQTKARGSLTRVTAPRATRRACDEQVSHVAYTCHTMSIPLHPAAAALWLQPLAVMGKVGWGIA